jgi:hypothetical protein
MHRETADALKRSLDQRTRRVDPQPDVDELLRRLQVQSARRQHLAVFAVVLVLVVGSLVGFLVGRSSTDGQTDGVSIAARNSVPSTPSADTPLQPADVAAAMSAIGTAFHDGFDGAASEPARIAATQGGKALVDLWTESAQLATRFGYTAEQIAGTTIVVSNISFIDATHAIVRFTLSIPGHGDVLADRIGYAVFTDGRWKISTRTACDILSLGGAIKDCPPSS